MTPLSVTAPPLARIRTATWGFFLRGQDDGQKIRNKIRY